MKKAIKGSFGYIDTVKKSQLLISILMFSVVIIIFFTGYFINDYSKESYFTVMSIVMVLPASMMLVRYLILVPFHSVPKNKYDEVVSLINERDILYTDFVITSTKKVMNVEFLVIIDKYIIGLAVCEKEQLTHIETYLSTNIKSRKLPYTVKLYNDDKRFMARLVSHHHDEDNAANKKSIDDINELKAFLLSLIV